VFPTGQAGGLKAHGNTADPSTLKVQIDKPRQRFGLRRVVLVGDRGMITQARISQELQPVGFDWITALRALQIQALAADDGPVQIALYDERDPVEITSSDYPGERPIVCRNPALAVERGCKRNELRHRAGLARHPNPGPPQTAAAARVAAIGEAVGAVLNRNKMAKHFIRTINEDDFTFARDDAAIAAEAKLDRVYVLRTPVPKDQLDTQATVLSYKSLSTVERTSRSCKTVDLEIRPVYHWNEGRVRAHVFCTC
jgi:transposase